MKPIKQGMLIVPNKEKLQEYQNYIFWYYIVYDKENNIDLKHEFFKEKPYNIIYPQHPINRIVMNRFIQYSLINLEG